MSVRDLILLINPVNGPIGLWLAMNLELCCEQQIKNLQHRMIENICNYSFLDSQFMEDTWFSGIIQICLEFNKLWKTLQLHPANISWPVLSARKSFILWQVLLLWPGCWQMPQTTTFESSGRLAFFKPARWYFSDADKARAFFGRPRFQLTIGSTRGFRGPLLWL